MATATRVAGDEEDKGVEEGNDDEEGDGDGGRSGGEGDDVDDDKVFGNYNRLI